MSKFIKENIIIQLNTLLTKEEMEDVNETLSSISDAVDTYVYDDKRLIDVVVAADVVISHDTMEIMNALHAKYKSIQSILVIDVNTSFGGYSYAKTDATDEKDAGTMMHTFVQEIKSNLDDSTNNINW